MPLSPIQMFQNNGQNSIEGLLRAGPEAISNIMNQAISIGRSMSDKQLAQERDLFAVRQQETNLMQRRAENTQQDMEDALRFGRSVYESDRRYRTDAANQEFQKNRMSANDVFSQGMDERQMRLSEEKFDYVKGQDEAERKRQANARDIFDQRYAGTPTEAPATFSEKSALSDEQDWTSRGAKPVQAIAESTYSDGNVDTTTQVPKAGFNAQSMFGTPAPSEDLPTLRADIKLLQEQVDKPPEGASPESVRNAAIRLERMREQEASLSPKTDTAAKEPSAASEDKEIGMLFKNKRFFPAPGTPDSELYEKDKETNELNSAFGMTKDEYIGKVKNPDAAAARGRVWEYAQKRLGGKSGGNSDLDWMMR